MTKACTLAVLGSLVLFAGLEAPLTRADDPAPTVTTVVTETRTVAQTYQGWTARTWAAHAVRARRAANRLGRLSAAQTRTVRRLRREERHRWAPVASVVVPLAAIAYGQSAATLLRKGACESHWDPYALNASGAGGWFQFLPSTWASTPYAGFSRFDPLASALAASWMHFRGRGGEWSCR